MYYPVFYCWYTCIASFLCQYLIWLYKYIPTYLLTSKAVVFKAYRWGREKYSNHPEGLSSSFTFSDLPLELRITAARGHEYWGTSLPSLWLVLGLHSESSLKTEVLTRRIWEGKHPFREILSFQHYFYLPRMLQGVWGPTTNSFLF